MNSKRLFALSIPIILLLAWLAGALRIEADLEPFLKEVVPQTVYFRPAGENMYQSISGEQIIGYVALGKANGYGGPMRIAVGVDTAGLITGLSVIRHSETPSYYKRVAGRKFWNQLIGRNVGEPLQLNVDIDGISSATATSRALVEAVREAARAVGNNVLGMNIPEAPAKPVKFGWPEGILALLFAAGIAGSYARFSGKKTLHWIVRLASLLFLGFLYSIPLTLAQINSLLIGYLPNWREHIYWYFLITGMLLPVILTGKNLYCNDVCPFGAFQEGLGALGGKKKSMPDKIRKWLRWFQGILATAAIILAIFLRNPGLTSFEIFGSLFNLTGAPYQFAVLGIVVIGSLFIARPWCSYLCPIRAVERYLRKVRSVVLKKKSLD